MSPGTAAEEGAGLRAEEFLKLNLAVVGGKGSQGLPWLSSPGKGRNLKPRLGWAGSAD